MLFKLLFDCYKNYLAIFDLNWDYNGEDKQEKEVTDLQVSCTTLHF